MIALKRNYWAVAFGSFINLVAKLLLLTISVFLITKASQITDPLFTLIAYFVLIISLIWILGLNYFFQKIFIDPKQGLIIQNFRFFKTTIPAKDINTIRIFQTFFDKQFDTYSLKVSFLDEDQETDEITIHGVDISSIDYLNEKTNAKFKLIFDASLPKKSPEMKSMKSKKSYKPESFGSSLELLEKRFRQMWLINTVFMILLVSLFVFFMIASQPKSGGMNFNSFSQEGTNEINGADTSFRKVFAFNETSPIQKIYFYETEKDKYALDFLLPGELSENSESFALLLRSRDDVLLKYTYDLKEYQPKEIHGPCLNPGMVNSGIDQDKFKLVFDYKVDEAVCSDVDNVVVEFKVNGSIVRLVGVLQSQ